MFNCRQASSETSVALNALGSPFGRLHGVAQFLVNLDEIPHGILCTRVLNSNDNRCVIRAVAVVREYQADVGNADKIMSV